MNQEILLAIMLISGFCGLPALLGLFAMLRSMQITRMERSGE